MVQKVFTSFLAFCFLFSSQTEVYAQKFVYDGEENYIEIMTPQIREKSSGIRKFLGMSTSAELYMLIYLEKEDALIGVEGGQFETHEFVRRSDTGKAFYEETEMHFLPLKVGIDNKLSYLGYHIRLGGIDEMPEARGDFPLTLIFRSGSKVDVEAKVINPRGDF